MIADDVRLELVNRTRLNGKAEVSRYFGNYSKVSDWHLVPGLVEGRPAILVFDPNEPDARPKYFMLLGWSAGKVATIRDFRHAPYVIDGADFRLATAGDAALRRPEPQHGSEHPPRFSRRRPDCDNPHPPT